MAVLHHDDGKPVNREEYEYKTGSVNVAGITGDTDIKTLSGFTTIFDTVKVAHYIKVEATGTAYIRLNSATGDKITIGATSPYENRYIKANKLFITTGGSAVTVTINLA